MADVVHDPELRARRSVAAGDPLDLVLQRLYALGLTIQGVAGSLRGDERGDRLTSAVESIDVTIREVRHHMEQTADSCAPRPGSAGGRP